MTAAARWKAMDSAFGPVVGTRARTLAVKASTSVPGFNFTMAPQ